MFETYRELISNQYAAALGTLGLCIDACPDKLWNEPVGHHPFCRVVFHTLFYADYYLSPSEQAFRDQPFHHQQRELFSDYEELEDRDPVALYERASVIEYLEYCREKAAAVSAAESEEALLGPSGYPRRNFTRAELHVYNIRHIQHHAAQLSLRLRLDTGDGVRWVRSGWPEQQS